MIGLYTDGSPSARYTEEILSHAGLPWRPVSTESIRREWSQYQLIILTGSQPLRKSAGAALARFVREGGALVAMGATFGLSWLLGARSHSPLGEGFLAFGAAHPIGAGLTSSLHCFGGARLRARGGTGQGKILGPDRNPTHFDALVVNQLGRGVTVTLAADIAGSVMRIQQGRPVDRDGEPAPDGTGPIDDGILKTDDGCVLSWQHDRERTRLAAPEPDCPGKHSAYPDGDTPWFAQPVADELRLLLLRAVLWAAAEVQHPLPMLWYWPRGLRAVGLISHDSDLNVDASAHTTLRLLAEAGVRSTWCMQWGPLWPDRFLADTYEQVKAAGHEVALHYNGLPEDGGAWGREHLKAQHDWLRQEAGVTGAISNKNHYLRWEGEVEFFRWLEQEGIESDQSKGPSKRGNVGYLHGSCLPWFPYDASQERFLNVLEIPLQTQDLWLTAPYAIAGPILAQSVRHHGVAHFLFHQIHIHRRPEVAEALHRVVDDGRRMGLEWWPGADINAWERLRRQVTVTAEQPAAGRLTVRVTAPAAVNQAGLCILLPAGAAGATARAGGRPVAGVPWDCHGSPAVRFDLDLPAGTTVLEVNLS